MTLTRDLIGCQSVLRLTAWGRSRPPCVWLACTWTELLERSCRAFSPAHLPQVDPFCWPLRPPPRHPLIRLECTPHSHSSLRPYKARRPPPPLVLREITTDDTVENRKEMASRTPTQEPSPSSNWSSKASETLGLKTRWWDRNTSIPSRSLDGRISAWEEAQASTSSLAPTRPSLKREKSYVRTSSAAASSAPTNQE